MNATHHRKRILAFPVICLALMVATAGCNDLASQNNAPVVEKFATEIPAPIASVPATTQDQAEPPSVPTPRPGELTVPKQSTALQALKPDEVYEPSVVLSHAHQQTCLVNVGDKLPNVALKRLTGEPVTMDEIRGERLTVVVFWSNRFAFGREQFRNLPAEVAGPFRHLNIKVVAINVGDPIEQIELEPDATDQITCLHDSDGMAWGQVATAKLPRTYLIDAEGRILWFDIEYSRTTRRQLKNAIFYFSREAAS